MKRRSPLGPRGLALISSSSQACSLIDLVATQAPVPPPEEDESPAPPKSGQPRTQARRPKKSAHHTAPSPPARYTQEQRLEARARCEARTIRLIDPEDIRHGAISYVVLFSHPLPLVPISIIKRRKPL